MGLLSEFIDQYDPIVSFAADFFAVIGVFSGVSGFVIFRIFKFVKGIRSVSLIYEWLPPLIHFKSTKNFEVDYITGLDEISEIYKIDKNVYGDKALPEQILISWLRKYANVLCGIWLDQRIVGAIGMAPVSQAWISGLRSGQLAESSLSQGIINPKQAANWYITSIVLDEKYRGGNALPMLLRFIISEWIYHGYARRTNKIWATAWKNGDRHDGLPLLNKFGFKKAEDGSKLIDKNDLYVLEVNSEYIKAARRKYLVKAE